MDVRHEAAESEKDSADGHYRIFYKRGLGRKRSQVILTNLSTHESVELNTISKLGEGAYGTVREFRHKELAVAIKHPHYKETLFENRKDRSDGMNSLQREQEFLMRCYPKDSPYALFVWPENDENRHARYPYRLDSRSIMPLVKGVKFKTWLRANTDYDMLALVIFNIAKELQRFHELGILHGDVSSRNIMIAPDLAVHFIDFSFTYDITDKATTFTVDDPKKCYIAPERLNLEPLTSVKANFSQDVYSLAFCLDNLINHYVTLPNRLAFYQQYPAIERFIAGGMQVTPDDRPTLESLIKSLSHSLIMPSIKLAINILEGDYLTTFLKSKIDCCDSIDINRLFFALCLQKKYEKVEIIIDLLRQEIPAYKKSHLLDIFTVIVELRKQVDKLHQGVFHDEQRRSLINQLATALKFAESVVCHPNSPLPPELLHAVHHAPTLYDIHYNMYGDQPLGMSISSSEEMSITNVRK